MWQLDLRCTSTGVRSSKHGTSSRNCGVLSRNSAFGSLAAVPLLVTSLLLVTPLLSIAPAPSFAAESSSGAPDKSQIARAIDTVKADPNLATERTMRTLRWAGESQPRPSDAT